VAFGYHSLKGKKTSAEAGTGMAEKLPLNQKSPRKERVGRREKRPVTKREKGARPSAFSRKKETIERGSILGQKPKSPCTGSRGEEEIRRLGRNESVRKEQKEIKKGERKVHPEWKLSEETVPPLKNSGKKGEKTVWGIHTRKRSPRLQLRSDCPTEKSASLKS